MQIPKRRRVIHPKNSPFKNPKAVVQQHLKDSTDINEIVARARRGIPPTNMRQGGNFVDVSNLPTDLTSAFNAVDNAWESFMKLHAKAREELGNDPRRLTTANADFFKRHGLMKPQVAPEVSSGAKGGEPPKQSKKAAKAASPDPEDQD